MNVVDVLKGEGRHSNGRRDDNGRLGDVIHGDGLHYFRGVAFAVRHPRTEDVITVAVRNPEDISRGLVQAKSDGAFNECPCQQAIGSS